MKLSGESVVPLRVLLRECFAGMGFGVAASVDLKMTPRVCWRRRASAFSGSGELLLKVAMSFTPALFLFFAFSF